MNEILEIAKYILPSAMVLIGVFLLLNHYQKKEEGKQNSDMLLSNNKIITPIRLQAYERISILLERIHPEAIIQRINAQGLNSAQTKALIIKIIREEFDHNISQQLYLSSTLWQTIRNAKEQLIRLVNVTASETDPNKHGIAFLKSFLEKYLEIDPQPLEIAIEMLKQEVRQYYSF